MKTMPRFVLLGISLGALALGACTSDDDHPSPLGDGGTGGGTGSTDAGTDGGSEGGGTAGEGGTSGEGGTTGEAGIASDGGTTGEGGGNSDASAEAGDGGNALALRGEYLVKHVAACGDCHTPRLMDGSPDMTKWLAGSPGLFQVPGLGPDGGVGIVSPRNLTPDMVTGIGKWTDDQIKKALLDGIDDENKALFPIMPYFVLHNMSMADADAIVAYLRTIPAVNNDVPERNFDFAMPAMPVPATSIPDPTLAATDPDYASAMRGKYLAGNVGICMECHTTHVMGPVPLDLTKLFAGGEDFQSAALGLPPIFPPVIYSENVTPHASGIQGWAATDVVRVLKQGKDKDGLSICPPMPVGPDGAFGGLTDTDALDIANYLVHLPPISNTVTPICHKLLAGDGGGGDGAATGSTVDGAATGTTGDGAASGSTGDGAASTSAGDGAPVDARGN